jgi:hypothetical protein
MWETKFLLTTFQSGDACVGVFEAIFFVSLASVGIQYVGAFG